MSLPRVVAVAPGSPAARAGLQPGDEIVARDGQLPRDIIEYQLLADQAELEFDVRRGGLVQSLLVTRDHAEPLGIEVDAALFDRVRTCDNHCEFCFIHQLPPGMRRSLYTRDDDYRLSWLYGNFTTLTRFTEADLERVVTEGLSPLWVSIHATDPDVRARMLRNRRGATSLRWLRALLDAGIEVHGQVVVCPGVNDGAELERTLEDVVTRYPELASVALVPVGVSDFSPEEAMRAHDAGEAARVVDLAERYATITEDLLGRARVFASDEFYLVAGRRPPAARAVAELDEAENGVGLVAAFERSFRTRAPMVALGSGFFQSVDGAPAWGYRAARAGADEVAAASRAVVLTGEYAQPLLRDLLDEHGFGDVEVAGVANTYFGGNIKVAGLLTGHDLSRQLASYDDSVVCLLPDVCLSEGRFLDGTTLEDLPRAVTVVPTTGRDLREALEAVTSRDLVRS